MAIQHARTVGAIDEDIDAIEILLRECAARLRGEAGWVLVPREPTEAMLRAGRLENGYVITDIVRTKQEMPDEILSIRYRAMLAAFTRDLETPGEG